jgi:HJR/Mrr/RecB family endonuclease
LAVWEIILITAAVTAAVLLPVGIRLGVILARRRERGYKRLSSAAMRELEAVDLMDGHEFEYFVADLLNELGFEGIDVTPGSGDQGVDVLAERDGVKFAFQCKNYESRLSNTPVQEVAAGVAYYGCHVGVVVTNSDFTDSAILLADANRVLLWDRRRLGELIDRVNRG